MKSETLSSFVKRLRHESTLKLCDHHHTTVDMWLNCKHTEEYISIYELRRQVRGYTLVRPSKK